MPDTRPSKRIIVATELRFWREPYGASLRIAALCRALQRAGHAVSVFFPDRLKGDDATLLAQRFAGIPVHTPGWWRVAVRGVRRRIAPWFGIDGYGESSMPRTIARPWQRERLEGFRAVCKHVQPELVLVEYLVFSDLLDARPEGVPMVLDTIDILSRRAARFRAEGAEPTIELSPEQEAGLLRRYDALLAIQSVESELLRELCPDTPVVLTPHPVKPRPLPPRGGPRQRLLFVGGQADHNRHAIAWFLAEVWGELRREMPELELYIAGPVSDGVTPRAGVRVLGRVEAIEQAYRETDIAINPARSGSGLKIKNVEALGFARPLVTSSIGAEGMEDGAGAAFLLADTPDQWRAAIQALTGDASRAEELSRGAETYVREHFSEQAAFGPLLDFIRRA